jgi:hypothetical protein
MQRPGKPGTGLTGARNSLAGDDVHAPIRSVSVIQAIDLRRDAVRRLHSSPRLQRAFEHLHQCGPRPVREFCAELIVLDWRKLDARMVKKVHADKFAPPRLHAVPL